jgi:hypothetical protein
VIVVFTSSRRWLSSNSMPSSPVGGINSPSRRRNGSAQTTSDSVRSAIAGPKTLPYPAMTAPRAPGRRRLPVLCRPQPPEAGGPQYAMSVHEFLSVAYPHRAGRERRSPRGVSERETLDDVSHVPPSTHRVWPSS